MSQRQNLSRTEFTTILWQRYTSLYLTANYIHFIIWFWLFSLGEAAAYHVTKFTSSCNQLLLTFLTSNWSTNPAMAFLTYKETTVYSCTAAIACWLYCSTTEPLFFHVSPFGLNQTIFLRFNKWPVQHPAFSTLVQRFICLNIRWNIF